MKENGYINKYKTSIVALTNQNDIKKEFQKFENSCNNFMKLFVAGTRQFEVLRIYFKEENNV